MKTYTEKDHGTFNRMLKKRKMAINCCGKFEDKHFKPYIGVKGKARRRYKMWKNVWLKWCSNQQHMMDQFNAIKFVRRSS